MIRVVYSVGHTSRTAFVKEVLQEMKEKVLTEDDWKSHTRGRRCVGGSGAFGVFLSNIMSSR